VTPASVSTREFDCIVVGAGMAGMTFAALMAQRGKRVLVVEQHSVPGGLFTAFNDRGFQFNVGLEWTTDGAGGALSRLLARLGVAQEYPLRRLASFKVVHAPELAEPLELCCSREALTSALAQRFPRERQALETFLDDCEAVCGGAGRAQSVLLRAGLKPVRQMLAQYFEDALLRHVLYGLLAVDGLGVLLMFIVASMCRAGLFVPEHFDHRRLPLLLDRRLRAARGTLLYRRSVDRILAEDGVARGVRLESGEEFRAPLVVASVDAHQLYGRMLRACEPSIGASSALRAPGPSSFCVFLGLRAPLPEAESRYFSRLVLAPTPQWSACPDSIETVPLRVEFQSLVHSRLAPTGKATLCIWGTTRMAALGGWGRDAAAGQPASTEAYAAAKAAALEIVLARVEAALPGVRERIETVSTASPHTFERYTRSPEGSVTGADMRSASYLRSRGFETPVRGLFHIGQWTVQSGVNSVMYSAERLFDALQKEELSA
jgi:phytoene dehydrogenase-like protein